MSTIAECIARVHTWCMGTIIVISSELRIDVPLNIVVAGHN